MGCSAARKWVRALACAALATLALAGAADVRAASAGARFVNWAQTVLLGPEYGGDGNVVSRWPQLPAASIIGATPAQAAIAGEVIDGINEALASVRPEQQIALGEPDDDSAPLAIIFAPLGEFARIAEEHGFPYTEGNWGFFWMFWDDHAINRAVVLLASDALQGDELRHFAFEEITQSLGAASDSPAYPDSVFYADGDDGGSATTLSAEDRKLLRMLYGPLQPGDGAEQVRAAAEAAQ